MEDLASKLKSLWDEKFGDDFETDCREIRESELGVRVIYSPKLEKWYRSPEGQKRYARPKCFFCEGRDEYHKLEEIARCRHLGIYFNLKFVDRCHFLIAPEEHREYPDRHDIIALRELAQITGLSILGNFRDSGASYPSHVHYQSLETEFPITKTQPADVIVIGDMKMSRVDNYPILAYCFEAQSEQGWKIVARTIRMLAGPYNILFYGNRIYLIPRTKSVPCNTQGFKFAAAEVCGCIFTRTKEIYQELSDARGEWTIFIALHDVCLPSINYNAFYEAIGLNCRQSQEYEAELVERMRRMFIKNDEESQKIRYKVRRDAVFDCETRRMMPISPEMYKKLCFKDYTSTQAGYWGESISFEGGRFEIYNHRLCQESSTDFRPISDQNRDGAKVFTFAPNRLYLELTRQCNLRCRMCYNAAAKTLPGELTTKQWKSLLDQMYQIGVFEARFTGGEPTLRPDFLEILDYAIALDFYVSVASNGVWMPELREEICARKIDDVIISLDGPEEINDQFRVGGSFKETVATIRTLKQAGIPKVRINTVVSKLNWQYIEPLMQLCAEHDLLLIDFIHPRPFGRGASNEAMANMLTAEETYKFNKLVAQLRKKYPTVKVIMDFDILAEKEPERHPIVPRIHACPAGREFAFVSPQGNVFPCGVAPVHDINQMTDEEKRLFIAGNVLQESLLRIWHCSSVWDDYRDLKQCKPQKCFDCRFWGKKCFGTCPVGAYYETGRLNGEDHYCYSHLVAEV